MSYRWFFSQSKTYSLRRANSQDSSSIPTKLYGLADRTCYAEAKESANIHQLLEALDAWRPLGWWVARDWNEYRSICIYISRIHTRLCACVYLYIYIRVWWKMESLNWDYASKNMILACWYYGIFQSGCCVAIRLAGPTLLFGMIFSNLWRAISGSETIESNQHHRNQHPNVRISVAESASKMILDQHRV